VNKDGTILIIDDDEDYACLLETALQQAGIVNQVKVLENGEAALTYLQSPERADRAEIPALILLDLRMPRVSGLDVLRWIHTQPWLSGVPVILSSGAECAEEYFHARRLGAASVHVKPCSYTELLDEVRSIRDSYLEPQVVRHAA
jgi:two-component system response regulator